MRFSMCSLLLLGLLTLLPTQAEARPKAHTAVCGAPIPRWGFRPLGKNRYRVAYRDMAKLLKFYRKFFGYRSKRYKYNLMFALPHLIAYHLRSTVSSTKWAGMNLVYYRRKGMMQIFVICRKSR